MILCVPERIRGDVRISFRGSGPARFRVQHAKDGNDGRPDDLSWCDISSLSSRPDVEVTSGQFFPPLVDAINGDADLIYRRHVADWLRVVPLDETAEGIQQCSTYRLELRPLESPSIS